MQGKTVWKQRGRPRGFTLIEVVAVLLILSFLVMLAAVSLRPEQDSLATARNNFRASLRYAQSLAVSQSHLTDLSSNNTIIWGLSWNGGNYTLQAEGGAQNAVNLPGSNSPTVALPDPARFTSTGTIFFNYRGQPVSTSGTALTNDRTIGITAGGVTQNVTVVADTGFVQ